jgi:hypothetical protein
MTVVFYHPQNIYFSHYLYTVSLFNITIRTLKHREWTMIKDISYQRGQCLWNSQYDAWICFCVALDTQACGRGTRVVHSVTGSWAQLVGFRSSQCSDKWTRHEWHTWNLSYKLLLSRAEGILVNTAQVQRDVSEMFHKRKGRVCTLKKITEAAYSAVISFYICLSSDMKIKAASS